MKTRRAMQQINDTPAPACLPVAVIIPALNEEKAIPFVLRDLPRKQVRQVLVIDNGSTDQTAEVARAHGATVIEQLERGYGAACLAGLAAV
jgi:glycosyltransferase involved in cell wall biosynthesis